MFGVKFDGHWNANKNEFINDTNKQFDWVYLVDSMGYTRFNKEDKIQDRIKQHFVSNGFEPFNAINNVDKTNIEVIGVCHEQTWDKKTKYIIVHDNLVQCGIHSDCIQRLNKR